ncbi:MAG: hypothetical protein ABIG37_01500 [Nanoarchaeota archaeon]|nr:hypothetical protein [Nanoarchaeota archaeon]
MAKEERSLHRRALEVLRLHPEIIGLQKKEVLTSSVEVALFKRGSFYTSVDLIYWLKSRKVVIVEYKSNGEKNLKERGEGQLEKSVDFYQKEICVPAEGRLITGDSYPILRNKLPTKKIK